MRSTTCAAQAILSISKSVGQLFGSDLLIEQPERDEQEVAEVFGQQTSCVPDEHYRVYLLLEIIKNLKQAIFDSNLQQKKAQLGKLLGLPQRFVAAYKEIPNILRIFFSIEPTLLCNFPFKELCAYLRPRFLVNLQLFCGWPGRHREIRCGFSSIRKHAKEGRSSLGFTSQSIGNYKQDK